MLGYNPHAFIPPMMFTNTANMGLPLTLFAFGPAMLPAAVALFMISSLLHFTLGIRILAPKASLKGILKGPMLWAMIIGVVMSMLGLALPPWLATSTKMLGDAAIPLGLFTLGVGFASFRVGTTSASLARSSAAAQPAGHLAAGQDTATDRAHAGRADSVRRAASNRNEHCAEQYKQDPGLVSAIVVGGNIASLFFVPLALYLAL